jgi:hypothetical protein
MKVKIKLEVILPNNTIALQHVSMAHWRITEAVDEALTWCYGDNASYLITPGVCH